MTEYLWVVIALPLGGAVFLHFFGRRLGQPLAGWLATVAVAGSFGYAALAAVPFFQGTGHPETISLYSWIPAVGAEIELLWDPLSALMVLIVTGVGALIHLFSIGYMGGDERYGRYFAYLNLFAGSMLILVLANNFAMMFIGWELVGLCSYLLISFWFARPAAAAAGKKAFIVNRIGDFGFIVALMIIFVAFGTLRYSEVLSEPGAVIGAGAATAIGLLLLLGATGKSAQLPLYIWLPDAMEGPTPVSALIHAATMVTAGIYLIARTAAIYQLAPDASLVVTIVGTATALIAATIAVTQTDIKRVLAYSTISQLGYMFMAVGAAGYVAGMFHLMTHAFFKSLLFLGAGSVIHAMSDEQNMHRMGGLARKMPITAVTMAVGTLAIAGVVPFAGFFSKDEILAVLFDRGGWFYAAWGIGVLVALITAFYMTRQFVLVFLGKPRWREGVEPRESPATMTVPLIVLGVLSVGAGSTNTPLGPALEHFLEPSFEGIAVSVPEADTFIPLAIVSLLAALAGIAVALVLYLGPLGARARLVRRLGSAWETVRNGYYVDEMYGAAIVSPGKSAANWTAFVVDSQIVDGAVNGVGQAVRGLGRALRPLQTGFVRSYGVGIAAGAIALLIWLLARGGL